MSQMNAVGWFEIFVEDMARAVAFYQDVLGIELQDMTDPTGETEMMSFPSTMEAYGAAGALVKAAYAQPGSGGTQVYFSVEDCATQEARVEKAGGKIIRPKFSIEEYGQVVVCEDSEGNTIGFHSQK